MRRTLTVLDRVTVSRPFGRFLVFFLGSFRNLAFASGVQADKLRPTQGCHISSLRPHALAIGVRVHLWETPGTARHSLRENTTSQGAILLLQQSLVPRQAGGCELLVELHPLDQLPVICVGVFGPNIIERVAAPRNAPSRSARTLGTFRSRVRLQARTSIS